jgi:hypothetical protein
MRRYAMGTYDGKWSPSRYDEWKEIHFHDANRPQATLVVHFFCDGKTISGKQEDILFRLRQKSSLRDDIG